MVEGRKTPGQALKLIRKHTRRHGWTVEQLPGRGKGSHAIYVVRDADGRGLGRVGLLGHARDMSWTVTRSVEQALADLRRRVDGQVSRYIVHVTREDGLWVAVVEGVRGGTIDSRRLDRLEPLVRDLLAGLLDVDPDSFELEWQYDALAPATTAQVRRLHEARAALARAEAEYRDATGCAAHALIDAEHMSLRDAAALMAVSHQRVQQLVGTK